MKKWIISLLLILVTFPIFGVEEDQKGDTPKFPKGKGAILIDDLKEGKVYGSLEKMVSKKKAGTIRLIGHASFDAPNDKLLIGNKFVLIGWLGVQKKAEPAKIVMFKEPIVSSFIIKNDLDAKDVPLPTFGEIQYVIDAIKNLEEGKIELEDLKKKRVIKIPTGQGSEIILPVKKNISKGKNKGKELDSENSSGEIPSELKANAPFDAPPTVSHTDGQSRELFKKNSGTEYYYPLSQNQDLSGNLRDRTNSMSQERGGMHTLAQSDNAVQNSNNPSVRSISRGQDFDLHLLSALDQNHLPNIIGNAVVLVRNANNREEAYFVRNGRFVRNTQDQLIHREVNVNREGLPNGRVERTAENRDRVNRIIDDVLFDYQHSEEGQREPLDFGPEVTVELTEEGCPPLHDALQDRVIIMNKARTFENGRLIREGECERTLEFYPVRRDYLCENCQDEVDLSGRRAYARYMEYWTDKEAQRHNLGIKIDRETPFAFFENKEGCGFDTESENGFAIEMSKLGYLDRAGIFKTVENCKITESSQRFPIQETARGCELIHDFVNGISHEQKRFIFIIHGIEHESRACHLVEPSLPHEFVQMGCKPILDLNNHTITSTVRRRIRTSRGLKIITNDCEPRDTTHLQATRLGCENEYFHDYTAQRSYLKKRYFILRENNLTKYVTGCIRTDDFIPQQTAHNGEWEHDDENKISRPQLSLYIEAEQGRMILEPPRVRAELGAVSYTLARSENRATGEFYFEGCFRRTRTNLIHIYKRGDSSLYEHRVGPGNIIVSTQDECTATREEKYTKRQGGNDFMYEYKLERIIRKNPLGVVVGTSPWNEIFLGSYKIHESNTR